MTLLIIVVCVLVVAFNFLPVGISNADIVDGFYSTQSYAASVQSSLTSQYLADLVQKSMDSTVDDDPYVGEIRDAIVKFAINNAINYGNGYKLAGGGGVNVKQGKQIRYSIDTTAAGTMCSWPGCASTNDVTTYSGFENALASYREIQSDTDKHMHFSCHGSCTFHWKYFWADAPYYVGDWGAGYYTTDVVKAKSIPISSLDELKEKAKPGDILWNTSSSSGFAHSTLWLGDVTFNDLDGTAVTIADAVMNSGSPNDTNDLVIKPAYLQSGKSYFLFPLGTAIEYQYGDPNAALVLQDWAGDLSNGLPEKE